MANQTPGQDVLAGMQADTIPTPNGATTNQQQAIAGWAKLVAEGKLSPEQLDKSTKIPNAIKQQIKDMAAVMKGQPNVPNGAAAQNAAAINGGLDAAQNAALGQAQQGDPAQAMNNMGGANPAAPGDNGDANGLFGNPAQGGQNNVGGLQSPTGGFNFGNFNFGGMGGGGTGNPFDPVGGSNSLAGAAQNTGDIIGQQLQQNIDNKYRNDLASGTLGALNNLLGGVQSATQNQPMLGFYDTQSGQAAKLAGGGGVHSTAITQSPVSLAQSLAAAQGTPQPAPTTRGSSPGQGQLNSIMGDAITAGGANNAVAMRAQAAPQNAALTRGQQTARAGQGIQNASWLRDMAGQNQSESQGLRSSQLRRQMGIAGPLVAGLMQKLPRLA